MSDNTENNCYLLERNGKYAIGNLDKDDLSNLSQWANGICHIYEENNKVILNQMSEMGIAEQFQIDAVKEMTIMYYPVASKIKEALALFTLMGE